MGARGVYNDTMVTSRHVRWLLFVTAGLALSSAAWGQVSDNKSLNGKYFFRHTSFVTDSGGNVSDPRTGAGTITFDGAGGYVVVGQLLTGTSAPVNLSVNGKYAVKPGGFVTLDNPLRTGISMNARVGAGALVASTTDGGSGIYDLLIACLPPTQSPTAAAINGSYWLSTLEIPNGTASLVRDSFSNIVANGAGSIPTLTASGSAANLGSKLITQPVTGANYTISPDGSGVLTFPTASDPTTLLVAGAKTIYLSADGGFFIGGSLAPGGHGMIVGVKQFAGTANNASWSGLFWASGLRIVPGARYEAFTGSVNTTGQGSLSWHRRLRVRDSSSNPAPPESTIDFTPVNPVSLVGDGSATAVSTKVALAATGKNFSGSGALTLDPSTNSSGSFELYFGIPTLPQSGTGVFINPQAILNAASFSPAGNPVSPGELVTLFGTNLAAGTVVAKALPFPTTLGNVQVMVNNTPCPIYFVSTSQISALVPFGTTGPVATFVVTNGGTKSNSVDVPLANSAPGIFSIAQTGVGAGAILKTDYSVVSSTNPVHRGDYIQIYLTGLGPVSPSVADGSAAPTNPLALVPAPLAVFIGGIPGNVIFQGLAPGLAGLYQINVQIPASAPSGPTPLAILTAEAFTDMVDVYIQ